MENLLDFIVKNITGIDNYKIEKKEEAGRILFILKLPSDFIGLVIGREGKCIKAIRSLLKIRATLENVRVDLNIEPTE